MRLSIRIGVFLLAVLLLTGCDLKRRLTGGTGQSGWELDTKNAVSARITTLDGGTLKTRDAAGTMAQVTIFPDALPQDMDIEMVPLARAKLHDEHTVVDGIVVRRKGDATVSGHIELNQPAIVRFVIKGQSGSKAAIVRYSDDGESYTVLRTVRQKTADGVVLLAAVDGFSGTGARSLEPGETEPPGDASGDDVWTIYVNDTRETSIDIMTFHYHLWLVAVSPTPFHGTYTGSATFTQRGNATKMPIQLVFIKVATDVDAGGPAELIVTQSEDGLSTVGTGTLQLTGSGNLAAFGKSPTVDVHYKDGASVSEAVNVTLKVQDTKVLLNVPQIGEFQGVIRFVKKEQKKCDKSKLPPHIKDILDKYPETLDVQDKSFRSMKDAMSAAMKSIQNACGGTSFEWGGMICQDSSGNLKVVPGGSDSKNKANHCGTDFEGEVSSGVSEGCPDTKMQPVAAYHCHPSDSGSKKMSDDDVREMEDYGLKTTSVLIPGEGPDTVLTKDAGTGDKAPKVSKLP